VPGASATQNSSSAAASIGPDTPIPLSTGALPLKVLDAVLKSLPVDVSFVGADDAVMYYSDSPHRVFPRSPAIIGRAVQNCHPPKSVHIVEQIVEAFKRKEKDKADFWIQMGDRFIVISYKPIYDADGTYLGTLEMSGDATDVRALEGQRRLLDW
nr:PAS domain-containing protein [Spirochaetales bacterium]